MRGQRPSRRSSPAGPRPSSRTSSPACRIQAASAGRATTVTVILVIGIGAVVLVPSLFLLFRLFLKGTFDPSAVRESIPPRRERGRIPVSLVGILVVLLVVGSVLTVFADAGWAQALGVAALLIFVAGGFVVFATFIAGETSSDAPDPAESARSSR